MFSDGTIQAAFKVTGSTVTVKGVILANYERASAVQAEVYKHLAGWAGLLILAGITAQSRSFAFLAKDGL